MAANLKTKEGFTEWCRVTDRSVVFKTVKANIKDFDPESFFSDLPADASDEDKEARYDVFIDAAWDRFQAWLGRKGVGAEKQADVIAKNEAKPAAVPAPEVAAEPVKKAAKKKEKPVVPAEEPEHPAAVQSADSSLVVVKISDLQIDGENVRTVTDEAKLESFTEDISETGVMQPILITPEKRLIFGHRRVMAAQKAGLTELPAIIREADEKEIFMLRVSENMQRENLSPVDLLRALRRGKELGFNGRALARKFGIDEHTVSSYLKVTDPETGVWAKTLDYINENCPEKYKISTLAEMSAMGNQALWDFVTVGAAGKEKVTVKDVKEQIAEKLEKPAKKDKKKTEEPPEEEFEAETFGSNPEAITNATKRVVLEHLRALNSLLDAEITLEGAELDVADQVSEKLLIVINNSQQ